MEAYRDQYATLFNNGRNVVVIGISADPDTTLASWAREKDFPILFASDRGGAAGTVYGAFLPARQLDNRSLFVIGPDGRVAYAARPFQELSAVAYEELAAAVDRITPPVQADTN